MQSAIYEGTVLHHRFRPKKHKLSYRVFTFLIDLDELAVMEKETRLFRHNQGALFSFHDKDHGVGVPGGLRAWVEATLAEANINLQGGAIRLLCYPRMLGYSFNPLSTYYCYNPDGVLMAMIYEVHNTFGQNHSYVIPVTDDDGDKVRQACDKKLYVSPFMDMDCRYHFTLSPPDERVVINIDQTGADGDMMLKAVFGGTRKPFTHQNLARLLWRYPLMTLKVTAGIHWEALKIWLKGVGLVPRPAPPAHPVTPVLPQNLETKS